MSTDIAIPVIAIDGPSGSGKGTLAEQVAEQLSWHLLDSGALYRIIGVVADGRGIATDAASKLADLAQSIDIQFGTGGQVVVDGDNLSEAIRTAEAGELASKVAPWPEVRAAIMDLQRSFRRAPGLVADGRDMGTVVFPDAELKIFLDASAEVRAQRRYNQLKNKGLSVSLPGLLAQIQERDERDRGRAIAPLRPADDAVVIDSTEMSITAVLESVMASVARLGLDS